MWACGHVGSHAHSGIGLFCLGYPDQAVTRTNVAITEAERLAHPPSLALSLDHGARLLTLVGGKKPSVSGQTSWLPSRSSRVSRSSVRWEPSIAAGLRSWTVM
jgi:hypothetical protein